MRDEYIEMQMIGAEECITEIEAWARRTEMDMILDPYNAGDFNLLREEIASLRALIIRICLAWQLGQQSNHDGEKEGG